MSAGKIVFAVVGGLVVVGGIVAIAHASTKPAAPKYGLGTTVQGRSGRVYVVAPMLNPGPVAPGVKVMAVWDAQATANIPTDQFGGITLLPILTFAQQGDNMNARVFVSSTLGNASSQDPQLLKARADFGV